MNLINNLIRAGRDYFRCVKYGHLIPKNSYHDDIYIVEFPKSGVTYLSFILGNIEIQLSKREEYVTFYNVQKYIPDVHQLRGSDINRQFIRTFIKSHSEYNPCYFFVIYLYRNPFDAMVSYYNFLKFFGKAENDFNKFLKNKNYGIKKWCDHINSWYYKKNDAQRIHFVKYEDLVDNPVQIVQQIYANLGVQIDINLIVKTIEISDISNMKKSEAFYREHNYNYTLPFVGKDNKISKEELLKDDSKKYIYQIAKKEIEMLYPEFIKINYK